MEYSSNNVLMNNNAYDLSIDFYLVNSNGNQLQKKTVLTITSITIAGSNTQKETI